MLNKKILFFLQKILLSKNIYIFGRSRSIKLFDFSKLSKKDYLFSINIFNYKDIKFDTTFISNRTKLKSSTKHIVINDIKYLIDSKYLIKIGSIPFTLGIVLFFLDKIFKKKKNIFLVGFDFKFNRKYDDFENKQRKKNLVQQQININSQKIALQSIKPFLKNIVIRKVGYDFESAEFLNNPKKIIKKNHVEVVAEITTNHFGSIERCKELILLAKKAGADSAKLQLRNVETFYSKKKLMEKYISPFGQTFGDYRMGLEFNDNQIQEILDFASRIKIPVFFSVLDLFSFKRIIKFNPYRIKIPSTISEHTKYIDHISKNYKKEIVVSTGMTDAKYLKKILNMFRANKKLFLLHCISSYPPKYSDLNLQNITYYASLKSKYQNLVPGYSSHETDLDGSIYAVFAGAKMIEKHIKLDSYKWNHFDFSAVDAEYEFPQLVDKIRKAELAKGQIRTKKFKNEFHKYKSQNSK